MFEDVNKGSYLKATAEQLIFEKNNGGIISLGVKETNNIILSHTTRYYCSVLDVDQLVRRIPLLVKTNT